MIALFVLSAIFFILGCSIVIHAPSAIQEMEALITFVIAIISLSGAIVAHRLDTIIKKLPNRETVEKKEKQ